MRFPKLPKLPLFQALVATGMIASILVAMIVLQQPLALLALMMLLQIPIPEEAPIEEKTAAMGYIGFVPPGDEDEE